MRIVDGVPEAQPVSQVDLRERGLRAARARREVAQLPRGQGRGSAASGAALWDEVKDRLDESASTSPAASSSGCASRARWPPTRRSCCSTSRPRRSTRSPPASIEELIGELKKKVTILIVTHNMQQAARVSDYTAYMYLGELVEFGATDDIFMKPKRKETEDYITGRFG